MYIACDMKNTKFYYENIYRETSLNQSWFFFLGAATFK